MSDKGLRQLSPFDRFPPIWIFLSIAVGVVLGAIFPEIAAIFDMLHIDAISLSIAIGSLWMLYQLLSRSGMRGFTYNKNWVTGSFQTFVATACLEFWS